MEKGLQVQLSTVINVAAVNVGGAIGVQLSKGQDPVQVIGGVLEFLAVFVALVLNGVMKGRSTMSSWPCHRTRLTQLPP